MQIKVFPLKNKKTGQNTKPMLMFGVKDIEYQKRNMYHYGLALGERLMAVNVENTSKITVATTQHDLDNLTKGVIASFQPWDYALNIMFFEGSNNIVATRHEDKGSRDILILPIHIINEVFTIKKIINKAMEFGTFKKIYILTPLIFGSSQILLSNILRVMGDKVTVIALNTDSNQKFKKIKEYLPVYNDGKSQYSKFLLESLRKTIM